MASFIYVGDCCGGRGFVVVDEDTTRHCNLQWARFLVRSDGKKLLGFLQVEVGLHHYSVQLWWEASPWLSQVTTLKVEKKQDVKAEEEEGGGDPHAIKGVREEV